MIFILTGIVALAMTPDALNAQPHLLFSSGFEDSVDVVDMDVRGADGMDWEEDLEAHPAVDGFWLYNQGDDSFAEIRRDPQDPANRCLYLQIDRGKRIQCELNFRREADYRQVYTRFRVYWPESLGELSQYPGRIGWFTFLEIWEHRNPDEEGNRAGKARWTFSFLKDEGVGQPLYWGVDAEGAQPGWHDLWSARNRELPIPFGRWCTFEILFRRGTGDAGRIWVAVTPEGGPKQTVFDLARDTQHPTGAMPLRSFQLWKLYTHPDITRWMTGRGHPISAYYDDFEWWTDRPTE